MAKSKDPTLFGVFFAAFISVLIGLSLAIYTLATREPVAINKPLKPEEIKKHTVYFKQPEEKGRSTWRQAHDWFQTGTKSGVLSLTEQDLNQWSRATLVTPGAKPAVVATPTAEATPPEKDKKDKKTKHKGPKPNKGPPTMIPEGVSFATMDVFLQDTTFKLDAEKDLLTIGSRLYVPPLYLLKGEEITLQAQITGSFVKKDKQIQFMPQTMFIGSCPVPEAVVPFLYDFLLSRAGKYKEFTDLEPTWKKLNNAVVEKSTLQLSVN
ncbi:MAG: hypothetical protein SFY80_09605 [Verrucomicrobiota bacterium]|nr:hypothetical protein [Verrucomicrobiota bacterium]